MNDTPIQDQSCSLAELQADDFLALQGGAFAVRYPTTAKSTGWELELVEVRSRKESFAKLNRVPFTLLFRASIQEAFPQQIFCLHHTCLGRVELFLVPVKTDAGFTLYESVFS